MIPHPITGLLTFVSAVFTLEGLKSLLGQDPGNIGTSSILTQLGVFAVVVVVFKFMLNRQDQRDAKQDERDTETLSMIRDDLAKEREEHADTRQRLYDSLSTKEEQQ